MSSIKGLYLHYKVEDSWYEHVTYHQRDMSSHPKICLQQYLDEHHLWHLTKDEMVACIWQSYYEICCDESMETYLGNVRMNA